MITGFCVLVVFYLAYRLNRDEDLIVNLRDRVSRLEGAQRENEV